ncbi:hypothetical protein K3495_g15690, partial [Podosphaera aphanis]
MMICTSAISSIDSLLANFKGVEKEEGSAFQKYFRQAISLFAASDAALNPPPVPTHSRPAKGAGSASTSIPTRARQQMPTSGINLPRKPTASESSWATVIRNGHKKARAAAAETASVGQNKSREQFKALAPKKDSHIPPRSQVSGLFGKKQQLPSKIQDRRLFLRLPPEHEWRKLSPAGIRDIVVKKMAISPAYIRQIKPVRSGFALSPSNPNAREA